MSERATVTAVAISVSVTRRPGQHDRDVARHQRGRGRDVKVGDRADIDLEPRSRV